MSTVNLQQAAQLITLCGADNTFLLESEPGVGKSAILASIAKAMPAYKPVYVEAQTLDMGDIQMPVLDAASVRFVPNAMFMPDNPKQPMLIMLDEIGKANRGVQNALLRMMHEHRLGDYALPAGSIVFATTNNASDGVGDMMQAHARNRITSIQVSKPDADEWKVWAVDNDIDPALIAFVSKFPHALASYMDAEQSDNPYIFNPKKHQKAFVSPRSLEKASHITKQRINFAPTVLQAALEGTIGAAATGDLLAFLAVGDAIPDWGRIMADPKTCPVPDSPVAQQIMALGAITRLTRESVAPWMQYMDRLALEVQAMFATDAVKSSKASILVTDKLFTAWAVKNAFVF
jgi:hypothetical protein